MSITSNHNNRPTLNVGALSAIAIDVDYDGVKVTMTDHNGTTVVFNAERWLSVLDELTALFESANADAVSELNDFDDLPDEYDGYVVENYDPRGGYGVSLEGKNVGTFPTEDIATYELAKASAEQGVFPNYWFSCSRGEVDRNANVARFIDFNSADGNPTLQPLPLFDGRPLFEVGAVVYSVNADPYGNSYAGTVVDDYGALGVLVYDGDSTSHYDADELRAPNADELENDDE